MRLYSDFGPRRARQIVADLLSLVAIGLWIWLGVTVYGLIEALTEYGRQMEEAGAGFAQTMADVGENLGGVPVIGGGIRVPFDGASDAGSALEAAGQSLSFAGRYDPLDAIDLMRSVGWVVVPSIWWENSPVVIQEAKRAGTPLIVSDIGGMAEKVQRDVDGLHFKRAAPMDLARVMGDAAKPATRARFAETLRDVIGRDEFLLGLDAAFAPHPLAG
jgi:glycosyltransferase involved in cell wall biosynthesis